MLTSRLEDRFREALGGRDTLERDDSIHFAVDFVRLLARILPTAVTPEAREAMTHALVARTSLSRHEIDLLLDLALAPESRTAITETELRAFAARFGSAEAESLRLAVAEEVDLEAFSDRYGTGAALLLLDSLFSVAAVDGVISRDEISNLQRFASELGIDDMLVSALFKKHDVRHATGDFSFELPGDRYPIGRSTTAAIQLPDPQVSPDHAELVRTTSGWRVIDLGSGRPTLLNNEPVASAPFTYGDELRLGPYTLRLDREESTLYAFGLRTFSALSIHHLSRSIQGTSLLDDVSFTVFSGEVIALVGPSGAGKTTLLHAIAGIAPADSGRVLLDGRDFHALLAADRSMVGIVPQDDVVHPELSVDESLFYSGRLRFGVDVPPDRIDAAVSRVIDELGIHHIRDARIGDAVTRGISGGQRKRVSLGQELLTHSTRVLFLDEPTSGLDPQTAQDIVSLVRQLADQGRIIFLVTHDVSTTLLSMVDHLLVLAPGGRLAWFGPPEQAAEYFEVSAGHEIFTRLPERPPEAWGVHYRESNAYRKFVGTRERLLGIDEVELSVAPPRQPFRQSTLLQLTTLTHRYAKVKLRDRSGLAVLMGQAPFLGLAMWVVFPNPDTAALFMLALSALWFGASASVRELIAERAIWKRERRVGLEVLPYLGSKIVVLGSLVGLQCTLLAGMSWWLLDMGSPDYGFHLPGLVGVTLLTGWVGMALGLFMSALFSSSEAAVGMLPLVLIPQITFGGLIVKVGKMGSLAKAISYATITRYAFEATLKTGDKLSVPRFGGTQPEPYKISGVLYDLGFRTSAASDQGLGLPVLVGVLLAFLLSLLLGTTALTYRRDR